jgi:outer membrane protein assembly factor BamA
VPWLVVPLFLLCSASLHVLAAEPELAEPIPSLFQLQEAGAVIGEIRVVTDNIFDLDDPKENNALFRLANTLHIRTRPGVIERSLLFRSGEPLSVRLIEESERLLRGNRYIYDVSIRPVALHDGVVDIEVRTRDTWTLDPGLHFSRSGGANSSGLSLQEYNFLGTGVAIGISRTSNVDRSGTEFNVSNDHAFDGWTEISYAIADLDDGSRQAVKVARPFYALDTRWAAGVSAGKFDRIDSIYNGGDIVGQYRHKQDSAEAFGGWSPGLTEGWTRRYTLGLSYQDDAYAVEPDRTAPPSIPDDQTLVGPFLRYEVIEDSFEKFKNRNLIERTEYFLTGFHTRLQVGYAFTGLGSTRDLWLYSANVGNGYEFSGDHNLQLSASLSGQYGDGQAERQLVSGSSRYYRPQGPRTLFYAAASAEAIRNPEIGDLLLIGGDSGLRGYPLRYQSGERRVLLTFEERVYTDWYPFRLFRVGGAVFFDVGRAWGGEIQNTANPGWLSDVGFGLRLLSARSAFGNILHADVAFPLNADPSIDSVQFLLKTKASF